MTYHNKIAVVFGGTGFIGKHIVRELAATGMRIKVATRLPESAYFLKPYGAVGQVTPVACDYSDADAIRDCVAGADVVVNCIGILFEKRKSRFKAAHVDVPEMIAKACMAAQVSKFVHISALGCEVQQSEYQKSKYAGEQAILAEYPQATIMRPSVVFGEDDQFFNMFAELSRYLPFLPLIGGGKTKMQPVYVGDVADAVFKVVMASGADHHGKVYQLGGAEVLTFKQVYERLFKHTKRPRKLVPVPFCIAKMEAAVLSLLPKPLLTRDQVETLKSDNIVDENALGLAQLDITPTALDVILPHYLKTYHPGGRFADAA